MPGSQFREVHTVATDSQAQEVLLTRDGPVVTLTFNRPEARNALTWNMYERLYQACEEVDADDSVRVLVLRGAGGKAFVAGTDISQFRSFETEQDALDYEARGNHVMNTLESVRVPIYQRLVFIVKMHPNKRLPPEVNTDGVFMKVFKDVPNMRVAKLKRFMARPTFEDELELHRVDCASSHAMLDNYEFLLKKKEEFANEPIIPPPLVRGDDLMAMGMKPGPKFGEILEAVETRQLEGALKDREAALEWVKGEFLATDEHG